MNAMLQLSKKTTGVREGEMKILVGYRTDNEATYEYHVLTHLGDGLCRACRYMVHVNLYGKKVLYDGKAEKVKLTDIREKEID